MNLEGGTSLRKLIEGGPANDGLIGLISGILVPLIFALIFLYFVWGVVNYFFLKGDDAESRAKGGQFVLWSVIAIAVLVSLWGFVTIVLSTLGI